MISKGKTTVDYLSTMLEKQDSGVENPSVLSTQFRQFTKVEALRWLHGYVERCLKALQEVPIRGFLVKTKRGQKLHLYS